MPVYDKHEPGTRCLVEVLAGMWVDQEMWDLLSNSTIEEISEEFEDAINDAADAITSKLTSEHALAAIDPND